MHGTLSMVQDRLKGMKMRAGDLAYDVMLGRQTLLNCAAFLGYGEFFLAEGVLMSVRGRGFVRGRQGSWDMSSMWEIVNG